MIFFDDIFYSVPGKIFPVCACMKHLPAISFCLCIVALMLLVGTASAWIPPVYVTQWDGSSSGSGTFNSPHGVAVNTSGYVYVADTNNDRILVFTPSGGFVTKWGSTGAGDGQFSNHYGVAVNSSDYVYVADSSNDRIQVFTPSGGFVRKWGGGLTTPYGVAVNSSDYVYVADSNNDRIQVFTPSGTYVTKWGSNGAGSGQFNRPSGVAMNASGYVYVADYMNNRIQVFTPSGEYVRQWGGLNRPSGVAMNASGYVYVADNMNNRIQVFTPSGTDVTQWGSIGSGSGEFNGPWGVAVNASDYVYVADNVNKRIQEFSPLLTTPITAIGAITGTPQVGSTLTAGSLTPQAATVSYQWKESATAGGIYTAISGATSNTYTPVAGDTAQYIEVVATGTGGYTGTVTSAAVGSVKGPITAIGAITGTPQVGSTLTAGALTPSGAIASYQWKESATAGGTYTAISGATSNTYTPVAGDVNQYLVVVATGAEGYSGTVTSTAVGPVTTETTPTRTPTSSGGGGSSDSPSMSGTSSVIATSPGVSKGQTMSFTYSQLDDQTVPLQVTQVDITSSQNVGQTDLLITPVSPGTANQITGTAAVVGYREIEPLGINPNAFSSSVISFQVTNTWMNEHQINPTQLVMLRNHDGVWSSLPTTYIGPSGNFYTYKATTPGFSYFAVAVRNETSVTVFPVTTVAAETTVTESVPTTPITTIPTAVPVTTKTTAVPVVVSAPSGSSGIPLGFVVIGVVAIILVIGGILFARRWWIRRQNPVLFQKYD